MPYIEDDRRFEAAYKPRTPGELNYAITMLFQWYLKEKGKNYTHMNDCVGAAHSAVSEFQRRIVVPYECEKIAENGDVYYMARPRQPFNDPSLVSFEPGGNTGTNGCDRVVEPDQGPSVLGFTPNDEFVGG